MNETRRPRLLLADDSATIRKVVELTFVDQGVEVTAVADAQSAMREFVDIQPDLVMVDVGLEDTNGYRICEMIKADEATKHIPVILLVGSFEPFDQTEAERVCADGFLTKPFQSTRDLVTMVFELLGTKPDASRADSNQASELASTSDIEELYTDSVMRPADTNEFESVEDLFADSGLDDELIETSYPLEKLEGDLVLADVESDADSDRAMGSFDWSLDVAVSDGHPEQAESSPTFEPKFVFEEQDENRASPSTIEVTRANGETAIGELSLLELEPALPAASPTKASELPAEPSREFIALIAKRVVEHLSDRVVREIAQQAVPRIAEKLIREALDAEKKD